MQAERFTCVLCGASVTGYGNNPEPLAHYENRCCDLCNWTRVLPARFERLAERMPVRKIKADPTDEQLDVILKYNRDFSNWLNTFIDKAMNGKS